MKKLTLARKILFKIRIKRAKKAKIRKHRIKLSNKTLQTTQSFRPFEVSIWDGKEERIALCMTQPLMPPANIDFGESIDNTLEFLKKIRNAIGKKQPSLAPSKKWIKEKVGRIPRIKSFYDYSSINSISISAALVIASCYDRARRIYGATPAAVNYADWPPHIFKVLHDVGFFEFIGHVATDGKLKNQHNDVEDGVRAISAITGANANGLEECSGQILKLLNFLSLDDETALKFLREINSAVSEAMINVSKHAYPQDYVTSSSYDTVEQWWMTAQADRVNRTLKLVVYDQGATIPGTLPRLSWFKNAVEQSIRKLVPNFVYNPEHRTMDHEYINYSMQEGKTQTSDKQRGLGLPQMQSLIDLCDDGALTIVSRAGLYRYERTTGVHKRALPVELEGTLVEWHLTLPEGARRDE